MTTTAPAASGRSRSTPRRSRLDVSRMTSSDGFAGTSLGRTTVSRSGNQAYDGGGAQRSSPHGRGLPAAAPPRDRPATGPSVALESAGCGGAPGRGSRVRLEDGRLAEAGRESFVGDGHHAEPWTLDVPFDDLGDDLAHTHA